MTRFYPGKVFSQLNYFTVYRTWRYLEPSQTPTMKCFYENSKPLTIFAKSSILNILQAQMRIWDVTLELILLITFTSYSFIVCHYLVLGNVDKKNCFFKMLCYLVFVAYINEKLTHYCLVFPIYIPWKYKKTIGFLMFSRGMKREYSTGLRSYANYLSLFILLGSYYFVWLVPFEHSELRTKVITD